MRSKPRVYSLEDRLCFPPAHVLALLGQAPHVKQASMVVTGMTKMQAAATTEAVGFHGAAAGGRNLRMAMGNAADAMRDAGLLDEPGVVLVTSHNGAGPIVRVFDGERATVVGTLRFGRALGSYEVDVIPAGVE